MKTEVKNLAGKKVGDIDLPDAVFGAEVNEHLLWEAVKMQRAKQRVGSHSTKRRSEVRGGGKKPWKQKGTGNARQGSTRSPNFVGGGSVFGPKPRDYAYDMPKRAFANALRCALSLRTKEKKLVVLDSFALEAIKTAKVAETLETFGAKTALIVDGENEKLAMSARNLPTAKYLHADGLNVYDVLDHETLILTKPTVEQITKRLQNAGGSHAEEGGK